MKYLRNDVKMNRLTEELKRQQRNCNQHNT